MADFYDKKLRKVAETLKEAHPNDIALLIVMAKRALKESYSDAQSLAERTDVKLDPLSSNPPPKSDEAKG